MKTMQNPPTLEFKDLLIEDLSLLPTEPLVSICCITYNHEKFISDAIEGFLMQKTNFPIEILIHDDASTDRTADIVRKYQAEYPDLIRAVYQKENQFSQRKKFISFLFQMARGKYIALCEGDDYWTDPLKLQTQVDFLEGHPDFSICFHNVLIKTERGDQEPHLREKKAWDTYSLEDVIRATNGTRPPGHTSSVIFRNFLIDQLPEWYFESITGDLPLFILLSGHGLAKYINQTMGVHRIHPEGLSQRPFGIGPIKNQIQLFENINFFYDYQFDKIIRTIIARFYIRIALIYKQQHEWKNYFLTISNSIHYDIRAICYLFENFTLYKKLLSIKRYFRGTIKKILFDFKN